MIKSLTSVGTQNENEALDKELKINQNDPKYLRKIISQLINKSKSIIQALDSTMIKLQMMQKQKDFWKQKYLQCIQISSKATKNQYQKITHFNSTQLNKQLHQFDQICSFKFQQRKRTNTIYSSHQRSNTKSQTQNQNKQNKERIYIEKFVKGQQKKMKQKQEQSQKKRKRKINKSISTISFGKENQCHSMAQFLNKKLNKSKQNQINH